MIDDSNCIPEEPGIHSGIHSGIQLFPCINIDYFVDVYLYTQFFKKVNNIIRIK